MTAPVAVPSTRSQAEDHVSFRVAWRTTIEAIAAQSPPMLAEAS